VRRQLIVLSLAGILPMAIVAMVILAVAGRMQAFSDRSLDALAALLVLVLLASGLFVWLAGRRVAESIAALPGDEAKRLQQSLDEERRARQAAEAAGREKDEFLALLGHELGNPLGALDNAVRVLERVPAGSADFKAAREVIGRQTEQLAKALEDLREFGRAASGRIALHRSLFDLAQAVAGAVAARKHSSAHEWRLELRPVRLIGVGLLLAAVTGAGAWFFAHPFLTSHTARFEWPIVGEIHLPSAIAFDLGVFSLVVGATALILIALAHQSVRGHRVPRSAQP